jgi:FkbM family methyltransferase
MRLMESINKPEYLYQPRQAFKRLTRLLATEPESAEVMLPWGLQMRIRPREDLGRALWLLGVYDLTLCEAIWRLLDRGESAIDVGANIGCISGLMAARSGPYGSVISFEPHPKNFPELVANIDSWRDRPIARITPFELALSSSGGSTFLQEPADFKKNPGTASIVTHGSSNLPITTARLDVIRLDSPAVDLLKIDVEGHELEVLLGSRKLLETQAIRDIIFEDHSRSFGSPVASFLAGFGYSIFFLTRRLRGPLMASKDQRYPVVRYLPPNFLATLKPDRAFARFQTSGWQVLQPSASSRKRMASL